VTREVARQKLTTGTFFAFGDQGAFLKNRPLDPRKTFYKISTVPFFLSKRIVVYNRQEKIYLTFNYFDIYY
jgi:hypothetical protein